ncbi:hypothetical protein [Nonomuraea maheshkhaliensis]|uniref:YncE family protein n=1 Tax=Nonomuraea maheshkhaliensis TaxID=419590 RepID=UPI0031F941C5
MTSGLLAAPSRAGQTFPAAFPDPSRAASAGETTTDLGVSVSLSSVADLAVGAGRVFVSAGDRIVVADSAGEVTGAITGLSQVHGLAMTPDGTRLYAALYGSDEVAEINTAALSIARRIDLSSFPCPSTLALTGDRLWIGRGCGQNHQAGVIGLDLTTATPAPIVLASRLYSAPAIAAAGDTLVAGETYSSPASLWVYDIGQATPALRGTISGFTYRTAGIREVALTSDGSAAVLAAGEPTRFLRYDTTALSPAGGYSGSTAKPVSVAISADNATVAGGRRSSPGLTFYDAATGTELLRADNPAGTLVAGSITFSGNDAYALLRAPGDRLHLWRLPHAALPPALLTLDTSPRVLTGMEVLITGHLTRADGSPVGAQPLTVTRRMPDGTDEPLDGVSTAADGSFTISDTPPGVGEVLYTVAWAGDDSSRAGSAVAAVIVRHRSSLTMMGPDLGTTGTPLHISGVLETGGNPPPPGATLTVQRSVQGDDDSTGTTLPPVTVNDDGTFTFTDTPVTSGRHLYQARWAGNDISGPARGLYRVTVDGG